MIILFGYCRKDSQSYVALGFAFFRQVIKDNQLVFNKVTIVHLLFLINFASKLIFFRRVKKEKINIGIYEISACRLISIYYPLDNRLKLKVQHLVPFHLGCKETTLKG